MLPRGTISTIGCVVMGPVLLTRCTRPVNIVWSADHTSLYTLYTTPPGKVLTLQFCFLYIMFFICYIICDIGYITVNSC